jgi:predicted  nucleic acid-binding Zn-ribbon protein
LTPEELQQAKDRLAEYKRDLESVSEVDQERLKAVMKLEKQLNDVQAKRLSDFQLQMAEFDEMVKESRKEITNLNREINDAEKDYRKAKDQNDQAAMFAAQAKIDYAGRRDRETRRNN